MRSSVRTTVVTLLTEASGPGFRPAPALFPPVK